MVTVATNAQHRHPHPKRIRCGYGSVVGERIEHHVHLIVVSTILLRGPGGHKDPLPRRGTGRQQARLNPLARFVVLSHEQHQLRVRHRLENAPPGLQAARIHLGGIVQAAPGEAPATRAGAREYGQNRLRRLVNPGDLGQADELFGIAILYARRIGLTIRQAIVDRREPRRIGVAKPGHLHGRRTAMHHTQPMPGGVARKVNEHVGLIIGDLIGHRLVAQSIDPSPKIRPVAKLAG